MVIIIIIVVVIIITMLFSLGTASLNGIGTPTVQTLHAGGSNVSLQPFHLVGTQFDLRIGSPTNIINTKLFHAPPHLFVFRIVVVRIESIEDADGRIMTRPSRPIPRDMLLKPNMNTPGCFSNIILSFFQLEEVNNTHIAVVAVVACVLLLFVTAVWVIGLRIVGAVLYLST
jgi:hypothetical protein